MTRAAPTMFGLLALAACSDLQPIAEGVCGNGAVDGAEECDGAAPAGQACGAPGSANACFFTCDGSAVCATGSVCGHDGRCRAPSGTLVLGPAPVPYQSSVLRAGDVDGDGYADLIGVNGAELFARYGDGSADLAVTSSQVIATPVAATAECDLDADGRSDALVPTSLGIVTMLGSGARSFSPFTYSSIDLGAASGTSSLTPVRYVNLPVSTLLLASDRITFPRPDGTMESLDNQLRFTDSTLATCLDGTVVLDQGSAADPLCAATPTVGSLLNGLVIGQTGLAMVCDGSGCTPSSTSAANDPTDEVAIVVPGQTDVALLTATPFVDAHGAVDASQAALRLVERVPLPQRTLPTPVVTTVAGTGTAMFGDLDGDGGPDLLVPVSVATTGSNGNVTTTESFAIAYDTAGGALLPGVVVKSSDFVFASGTSQAVGKPRFLGDLNGDGLADLVTDTQVFITSCTPKTCGGRWGATSDALIPRPWTKVVGVDINHDGHVDLAGIVAGEPNVDVLLNANGQGLFNHFTVATSAPLRDVVPGDFDGDLVGDLALILGDTTATDEADQLAIVYGAPSAGPGAPVPMATFGVVQSTAAASIAGALADLDAITDLVIIEQRAGARRAAALLGNSSRQVVAPFLAPPPAALVARDFDAGPGLDVISIDGDAEAEPGAAEATLLTGTGGGDLLRSGPTQALNAPLGTCDLGVTVTCGPVVSCPARSRPGVVNGCYSGGCVATTDCALTPGPSTAAPVRGSCGGTIAASCKKAMPTCPAGTRPAIDKTDCWDDYCLTEAQCPLVGHGTLVAIGAELAAQSSATLIVVHSILPPAVAAVAAGAPAPSDCAGTDVVIAVPPASGSGAWTVTPPTVMPDPFQCGRVRSAQVRDLDHDGVAEVVIQVCPGEASCALGPSYVVRAVSGALDFAHPQVIAPPMGAACGRPSAIQLADATEGLVAACQDAAKAWSLQFYAVTPDGVTPTSSLPIAASDGRVVVADFNGDGLADVATTSGSDPAATAQVFVQLARGAAVVTPQGGAP